MAARGATVKETEWHDHFGSKYTSSEHLDWRTPQWLFEALHEEFDFTLDAAAEAINAKCKDYIGPDHVDSDRRDALKCTWMPMRLPHGARCAIFLNPPYGRNIAEWYAAAYLQSRRRSVTVVMLVNANTETTYWEKYALLAQEIRFISGRVGYDHPETGKSTGHMQTKGSALIIFRHHSEGPPLVRWVKRDALQKKGEAIMAARTRKAPPPPPKKRK